MYYIHVKSIKQSLDKYKQTKTHTNLSAISN